jgi:hypothetical protein
MIKIALCFINKAPHHKEVLVNGDIASSFLTSALVGGEFSAALLGRLTFEKEF